MDDLSGPTNTTVFVWDVIALKGLTDGFDIEINPIVVGKDGVESVGIQSGRGGALR